MKNIFYVAICLFLLIGCEKEKPVVLKHSDYIPNTEWNTEFSNYIKEAQKKTLSFPNIEELEKTVDTLLSFNSKELKEWYDKKGFVSQRVLYDNSIDELEKIGSIEDAENFKNKYKPFFLFNEVKADEDLSPYLPSSKIGYSYVCNVYGRVVVNGIEHNFNDYKSFEETNYARHIRSVNGQTKANASWDNYLYMESKDRKFWAEVYRSDFRIRIKLSAHKKNMFGWNKYKTVYTMRLEDFDKTDWACQWTTEENCELSGLHLLTRTGEAPFYRYETSEVSSGYEFHLGKSAIFRDDTILGGTVYMPVYLRMNVSTRGMSGGTLTINYPTM